MGALRLVKPRAVLQPVRDTLARALDDPSLPLGIFDASLHHGLNNAHLRASTLILSTALCGVPLILGAGAMLIAPFLPPFAAEIDPLIPGLPPFQLSTAEQNQARGSE